MRLPEVALSIDQLHQECKFGILLGFAIDNFLGCLYCDTGPGDKDPGGIGSNIKQEVAVERHTYELFEGAGTITDSTCYGINFE